MQQRVIHQMMAHLRIHSTSGNFCVVLHDWQEGNQIKLDTNHAHFLHDALQVREISSFLQYFLIPMSTQVWYDFLN